MTEGETMWWLHAAEQRLARLKKLIEMKAPGVVISGEVTLVTTAVSKLDAAHGDRAAYEAARAKPN